MHTPNTDSFFLNFEMGITLSPSPTLTSIRVPLFDGVQFVISWKLITTYAYQFGL